MAASTIDIERRATNETTLRNLELDQFALSGRLDRMEPRVSLALIIAVLAAGAALLFGIINFALLLNLIGRLS